MSALMSVLTSCHASRSELRGSFRDFAVDKFDCALCVGGGSIHRSIVSSQDCQPGCNIGRMIFTRVSEFTLELVGFETFTEPRSFFVEARHLRAGPSLHHSSRGRVSISRRTPSLPPASVFHCYFGKDC